MPAIPHRKMKGSYAAAIILLTVCAAASGCSVQRHLVGVGPNGLGSESARQYYIFFGLLRLNDVSSQRMTEDVSSYEIVTEYSFIDILLTPLLIPFTVTTRTVTVNR